MAVQTQTQAQPIWDAVLAAQPGLMLFGGDNVYASSQPWALEPWEEAYALQARVHELLEELEMSEARRMSAEAAVSAAYRRDLVPQRRPSSALVVWRPRTDR